VKEKFLKVKEMRAIFRKRGKIKAFFLNKLKSRESEREEKKKTSYKLQRNILVNQHKK